MMQFQDILLCLWKKQWKKQYGASQILWVYMQWNIDYTANKECFSELTFFQYAHEFDNWLFFWKSKSMGQDMRLQMYALVLFVEWKEENVSLHATLVVWNIIILCTVSFLKSQFYKHIILQCCCCGGGFPISLEDNLNPECFMKNEHLKVIFS